MKKRLISLVVTVMMLVGMMPAFTLTANAASAPTKMWIAPSETNGIPAQIDVFKSGTSYLLCLPGNVDTASCFFSWDGDMQATVDGSTYANGECPIPAANLQKTYTFKNGTSTAATFSVKTYKGSANVQRVFIDIDESGDNSTIAQMDGDADHEVTCTGRININGTWYDMPKIKGRGNATWERARDKRPYNVTLGSKINFPGIKSDKTKKWSFLAEITDHSLLSNRSGYHLANELGIGQDTTSADVWMNGEYQGCYTITPKTDSFVTKDGFMIEQDNYLEPSVANGGDPQFTLEGLKESSGWSSCYNRITVKKMGDNLLGEAGEDPTNMESVALNTIKPWLQDAWDAIRSDDGYNTKGKYYTEYIDIESFAKMYLMHEYAKSFDVCAGSILFHRDGMTDDDKLIAGPMWDLDNAMGSTCRNSSLGQADDRSNGDRRRGDGDFIPLVTEYKTSIYKTLSKHEDFMKEVYHQYNKHQSAFNSLPGDVNAMISDITDSATMNHYKVTDLGTDQYTNTHYYNRAQTLGSGQYQQKYLATTSSKTDWANYAANLKTYITARSSWFVEKFYDPNDPANCEHEYASVVTPPTCTTEGFTTYTCPKCGDSYEDDYTDIIAHDYQDPDEDGVYNCSVCDQKLLTAAITCSDGASVTVLEKQDPEGIVEENAESANPRNSDTGLIDCAGDGQINFIVNLDQCYELESVTAEPADSFKNLKGPEDTKIENGYRLTKVKGDLTITVTTKAVHDYEETVKDPTCTEKGLKTFTCKVCGDVKTEEIAALGHNMTEHAAVAENCTGAGSSAYWSCDRCGKFFSDANGTNAIAENSWIIDETGHKWDDGTITTQPTCTTKGVKTFKCTACGATKTEDVAALGHSMTEHKVVKETCTAAGNSAYWSCDRCGKYFSDANGANAITENSWVIDAAGHKWNETYTVDTPATCTAEGSESIHCSVCDVIDELKVTVIPKTDHNYGAWETTKAATCTEKGSRKKVCPDCGDTITEEIPATGHQWKNDYTVDTPATHSATGVESIHCSACNAIKQGSERVIPVIEHEFGEWVITKAATCTADGSKKHTCTDADCGYTETVTIPATGHKWESDYTVDKSPTCTAKGSESIHCSVCNAVREDSVKDIQATGHKFGDWKLVKEATVDEEGSRERECTVCGSKETQAIEKLDAQAVADAAVAEAAAAAEAAEKAAKEAAEAQAAADEAAKTPGKAAVAAAVKAKSAALAAQKAAATAKAAADKAKKATDKAKEVAGKAKEAADKAAAEADKAVAEAEASGSESEKAAAKKAKEEADKAKEEADKAYETANKSVESAEKAETEAKDAVADADQAVKTAEASITNAEESAADHIGTPEIILSKTDLPYKYKVEKVKVGKKKKATAVATPQKPDVTVKLNGKTIGADNYDVTWSNEESAAIGAYTIKVVLKNSYTGTAAAEYNIVPKQVNLKKVAKGKKKFTASWKKLSKNDIKYKVITGYQIRYATDADFSDEKIIKAGTLKSAKKAVGKLAAKKTYYVQLRTYKTVNGKNYFSEWSKTKTVKTK